MKVYDDMAEYYDLIYNDEFDLEFYTQEAKNARGPILEVACGTGRILLSLLKDGMDAYGIDLSEGMIRILNEKAKKLGLKPNVLKANMLDFKLDKKFKLIIIPYRSFLHLKSEEERKQALTNFKNHLDKDGRLILHTYNPSKDEYAMIDKLHKFASENLATHDGMPYTVEWFLIYNPKTNMGRYEISLTLEETKHLFSMEIAYLKKEKVMDMLKSCGYRNIKTYCGFNYSPFNENCREAIWIADS
jgi:ubiquinone/menaquinone biosynthesis C-methylase UbiE